MLLKLGSFLLVFLMTGYSIFHIHRNKEALRGTLGNGIPALLVGVASAAFAFLLLQTSSFQFGVTIGLSFVFVVVASFLLRGKKAYNELLSGILGVTAGLLVGYMTFGSTTAFFVVDVVFIIVVYLVLRWIDRKLAEPQSKKKKGKGKSQEPRGLTVILAGAVVLVLGVVSVNFNHIPFGTIGQPQNQEATLDTENNLQEAVIEVTPSGFNPKNTTIEAQNMVKFTVNAEVSEGKEVRLVSDDLKLNVKLKNGKNLILLDNPLQGKYDLRLEPGKAKGSLTVK
jgi:uncharacterized membrane protein HdeD (DUF308 family)